MNKKQKLWNGFYSIILNAIQTRSYLDVYKKNEFKIYYNELCNRFVNLETKIYTFTKKFCYIKMKLET